MPEGRLENSRGGCRAGRVPYSHGVQNPNGASLPWSPDEAAALRRALAGWFRRAGRVLPWRSDPSPYRVLVSEFMLQQTQVATVLPYFERWMERFPDLETLAAAEEEEILSVWQGLGYYSRARHLLGAAREIVARHSGRVPADADALESLPGIGTYTAGALMAFAHDRPAVVLDANISRVIARLADLREPIDRPAGRQALEQAAAALLPSRGGRRFASALMDLGATLCLPRKPECRRCPISRFCRSPEPQGLPLKAPRRATERAKEVVQWAQANGGIYLRRSEGTRWPGLWVLPPAPPPAAVARPLYREIYSILHYRVDLRVVESGRAGPLPGWSHFRWGELEDLPVPSPHRRALRALSPGGAAMR